MDEGKINRNKCVVADRVGAVVVYYMNFGLSIDEGRWIGTGTP